jgi:hypothetical protein
MRLQTVTLERGLAEVESITLFTLRDNPAKPLFHQGLQRCPLSMG